MNDKLGKQDMILLIAGILPLACAVVYMLVVGC